MLRIFFEVLVFLKPPAQFCPEKNENLTHGFNEIVCYWRLATCPVVLLVRLLLLAGAGAAVLLAFGFLLPPPLAGTEKALEPSSLLFMYEY